jgi:hypothetical protein
MRVEKPTKEIGICEKQSWWERERMYGRNSGGFIY